MRVFVHVTCHSSYSLLEGAIGVKQLVALAKKNGQPALGLTDRANLFGGLEFAEIAAREGIQPINGVLLPVAFGDQRPTPLTLLAMNDEGLAHLVKLTSEAHLDGDDTHGAVVAFERLEALSAGLICLCGAQDNLLFSSLLGGQKAHALAYLNRLKACFGDRLYIEIQRHDEDDQRSVEPLLVEMAYNEGVALVATQRPLFPSADYHHAHDALMCIAEGKTVSSVDRYQVSAEHYFKSSEAMIALFADLPEAIASTEEIARRCHARLSVRDPLLPRFDLTSTKVGKALLASEADELRRQAHDGLVKRLEAHDFPDGVSEDDYWKRFEYELDVIIKMEFPGYFLVVAEFIGWAKDHNIPVGPGRGSGAASVIAWALGITGLDPIRFNLLFERFLNPERISMPDFDIDFCQDRRDEVIHHVRERYGHDRVAAIITFGSLQPRAALRDIGRVLEMPYGQVDRLCKMVPNNPANPVTLAEAIAEEPRLKDAMNEEEVVARLIAYASKLEGLYRHASTHAAGIVIGDRPLQDLVPLYRDPRSEMPVTQYPMKWVEPAGLVKFDFLGLRTLSIIREAEMLASRGGEVVRIDTIPLDCDETLAMLRQGDTVGVFQVESPGMRRTLLDMQPTKFTDLIALVALFRPGPMQNIPTFCRRKRGDEEIDYLHPLLKGVLEETYGVIVYQEQVLQIAQILAGYNLGQADLLRRAMGKKIKSEMDQQKDIFADGAEKNGIAPDEAKRLFDLIARFADYGFNKAHSAAYALISYQTAWLKRHHLAEFLASSMTYESHSTDRVRDLWLEAKRMGVTVVAPSINSSGGRFDVQDGQIFYSLTALKGVGEMAATHIAEVRGDTPFSSLDDWLERIDARVVNKRALEGLIAAGAFDCLGLDRAALFASTERMLMVQNRNQQDKESGQTDLFGGEQKAASISFDLAGEASWSLDEKLKREYAAAGFFLSGHPLDGMVDVLRDLDVMNHADFVAKVQGEGASYGRLAASVIAVKERPTRKGGRIGIVDLSDASGQFEGVLFSEALNEYRSLLSVGELVLIDVEAEVQGEDIRLRLGRVQSLHSVAGNKSAEGRLSLSFVNTDSLSHVDRVKAAFRKGSQCSVELKVPLAREASDIACFRLPGLYDISHQQLRELRSLDGVTVEVESTF